MDKTLRYPFNEKALLKDIVYNLGYLNSTLLGEEKTPEFIENIGLKLGFWFEKHFKNIKHINTLLSPEEFAQLIEYYFKLIDNRDITISLFDDKLCIENCFCSVISDNSSPNIHCLFVQGFFGGIGARNFGYTAVVPTSRRQDTDATIASPQKNSKNSLLERGWGCVNQYSTKQSCALTLYFTPTDKKRGQTTPVCPPFLEFYQQDAEQTFQDSENPLIEDYLLNLRQLIEKKTRELRLTEEKYRMLFDNAYDAIYIRDYDSGYFIDVNQQAQKLYGYTKEEFLNITIDKLFPKDSPEKIDIVLDNTNNNNHTNVIARNSSDEASSYLDEIIVQKTLEHTQIRKDGVKLNVENHISIFNIDGKRIVQGIVRDITRQKEEEKIARLQAFQITTINYIAKLINSSLDLEQVLMKVFTIVDSFVDVGAFYICVRDTRYPDKMNFLLLTDYGDNNERFFSQNLIHRDPGEMTKKVLNSGKELIIYRSPEEVEKLYQTKQGHTIGANKFATSLLFFPLIIQGKVIGIMSIQSYKHQAYSDEDVELLKTLSYHVAIAIRNANLYTNLQKQFKQQGIIYEIGQRLSSTLNIREIYKMLLDHIRKLMPVDSFLIGNYDEVENVIYADFLADTIDEELRILHNSYGFKVTIHSLNWVIKNQKPIMINNKTDMNNIMAGETIRFGNTKKPSESFILIPLIRQNKTIGILSVQSYSKNAYEDSDLEILMNIANWASLAIENAKKYVGAFRETQ